MTLGRVLTVVFAVALLAVVVPPAAAQFECPEEDPGTPRAGIDCAPLTGGGVTTQTTCTVWGDIEWLMAMAPYQIPPGTCRFVVTFPTTEWTLTRRQWLIGEAPGEGILASYCPTPVDLEPVGEPEWQICNVPATGRTGRVLLVVALALLGSLILWRRLA